MHRDEVDVDVALVRRLVDVQFPEWSGLALEHVVSSGTVNALFKLGEEMVVRLPRTAWAPGAFDRQRRWLPSIAAAVPVAVPAPLARGTPAFGYPFDWGVHSWLRGATVVPGELVDEVQLARDLAEFVRAMWTIDPADGPSQRRGDLRTTWDAPARASILDLDGVIETQAATASWDESLAAEPWSGAPRWVHGDLMPANLLVEGTRLVGVIDWEAFGVGDPAVDLMVAWNSISSPGRAVFRDMVAVDDATWLRGRGWALCTGLRALPYYAETNPQLAANARFRISQVLGG
jgi:aminoglycoside phosphotransferase (APT) family kinase protein